MHRLMIGLFFLSLFLPSPVFAAGAPNPKLEKEYNRLVKMADLEKHPERHAQLAQWCRNKRWTSRAEHHQQAFDLHTFEKERKKRKDTPADLQRLMALAKRLKLSAEEAEMKRLWLGAEFKSRRSKVKAGDAAGMKALLAWAEKEGVGTEADGLAREVLKHDPNNEPANLRLGHVKDGDKWVDPWALLVKRGGLKDVKVRYAIHKQLDAARKEPARRYSTQPFAGLEKFQPQGFHRPLVWKDHIRGDGDGKGWQFLWAPDSYDPSMAWPLIVYLHGGGGGGVAAGLRGASNNLATFPTWYPKARYVVIAPVVRNHVINAWNIQENMLDVIDAIIHACERFHINKKRIYLTGASMGGQGTQRFSWVVPELFAAFSPRAGAYWNRHPVPDLTGKPFIVFHGDKDAGFRNKSLKEFLSKIRKANADVTYINFPAAGHGLPHEKVMPKLFEFFKKHTNEFAPDLRLVRRVIVETVKEKPHGGRKK